jgi:pimeloyl-ACP methyl ester carboxylesterase
LIERRHVFYVGGDDPSGAEGYYHLFQRGLKRFLTVWSLQARLTDLTIESHDIAHWSIEAKGPNWKVTTRYEFLRLEHFIRATAAQPLMSQLYRAVRWTLDDLASGATLRTFRASWPFALVLVYAQIMIVIWLGLAVMSGWLAAVLASRLIGWSFLLVLAVAPAIGIMVFAALRLLVDRWFVMRVATGWPNFRAYARGQATGYDEPIDVLATRIVAVVQANEVDELLIVGHSAGGGIAPAAVVRALELDPRLGQHGPRIVLLTLGSLLSAFALHPTAERLRETIRRLAVERSIVWIDCQAPGDILSFWDFDPVEGAGVRVGAARCNPLIWTVRLRGMLTKTVYQRLRRNYVRMHYQFIMANEKRARYDYFMLVCGPEAAVDLANHGRAKLVESRRGVRC